MPVRCAPQDGIQSDLCASQPTDQRLIVWTRVRVRACHGPMSIPWKPTVLRKSPFLPATPVTPWGQQDPGRLCLFCRDLGGPHGRGMHAPCWPHAAHDSWLWFCPGCNSLLSPGARHHSEKFKFQLGRQSARGNMAGLVGGVPPCLLPCVPRLRDRGRQSP